MVDITVKLQYADDHVEEFTINGDMTVTWTAGKAPGSMKLTERTQVIRLVLELISVLTSSSVKKFVMEEV